MICRLKGQFRARHYRIGCTASTRRKFNDLHVANKNQLAERTLHSIVGPYDI
tara:strand:+ start:198 stop:353 length:156 start_codon:yes stop_codon:yes gene_type:complete